MPIKTEVFNDFQGQILESDVDGIDAKKSFLARAENVILGNGFIENAPAFKSYALPGDIPSKINDEFYELLEMIPFYHSKKGQQVLYILWNEYPLDIADMSDVCSLSAGELTSSSRFVNVKPGDIIFANGLYLTILTITDSSTMTVDDVTSSFTNQQFQFVRLKNRLYFNLNGTEELDADEQNAGLQILEKPYKTNVNFVNDELKINLNCKAIYYDINYQLIFNLSLQYLKVVEYNETVRRDEGWYLCPRWLGGNYNNLEIIEEATTFFIDSFKDGIPSFFWSSPGWEIDNTVGFDDSFSLRSAISASPKFILTPSYPALRKLKFRAKVTSGTALLMVKIKDTLPILLNFNITEEWTSIVIERSPYDYPFWGGNFFEFQFSYTPNPFGTETRRFYVDYFESEVEGTNATRGEYLFLAKFFNGERALIKSVITKNHSLSYLKIPISSIDWRVQNYECYELKDGLYKLIGNLPLDNGWETESDCIKRNLFLVSPDDDVQTLNNNYGLGATIRVDNQNTIHSEISFKNRVYFVKDDYRVYQSHIAGNGGIQPDSFPYDEDKLFGFFETARAFHNTGLATSIVNDLIVYSREGINVYQIEANGMSIFKRLTFVSSEGLSNLNLLTKGIDGQPIMDGSLWANANGLFVHPGGVTVPKNLILGEFSNYWAEIAEYINSSGFAFYSDSEYWLKVGEEESEPGIYYTTFAVFELDYKQVRFVKVEGQRIEKLLGYIGNTFYLKAGNTVYTLSDTEYLGAGYIETHTLEYDKYEYNNILQELFIDVNKNRTDEGTIALQVILDDIPLITYLFSTKERIPVRLAPISSRFQKIKLILFMPQTKFYLSDFGFRYSKSGQRALGMNTDHDQINKAKSGYGYHYGRHYGRNILK